MKPSEFARSVSEADIALGLIESVVCTESGCQEVRKTCSSWGVQSARELLDKLRELGLPDLLAELGKVVGRQVTVDDLCVFWGTYRLYLDCIIPGFASKERCREEYWRALEEARERLENAPGLKKRLENLLAKLGTIGRFRLEHSFSTGLTELRLPLGDDRCTLWLQYKQVDRDFMIIYFLPHGMPPAREAGEWLAEYVGEMLRGLGVNKYKATIDYGEVATRLSDLDPGAAFRLFGLFADLVPLLNDVCAALSVRRVAEKTGVRVKV